MFIGHIAVAMGAKKIAPKTSLGTLLLATQFVDLLWPIFLILGIEHVRINPGDTAVTPLDFYDYPISHSLLTCVGWSLLFGLIYYFLRKNKTGAWVIGLGGFQSLDSRFYQSSSGFADRSGRKHIPRSRIMELQGSDNDC